MEVIQDVVSKVAIVTMAINSTIGLIGKVKSANTMWSRFNPWRPTVIAIEPTFDGMANPIYKRLEQMITHKYQSACSELRLAPTRGEVSLDVSTKHMNKIHIGEDEGGPIDIELDLTRMHSGQEEESKGKQEKPLILLKSNKLEAKKIRTFVENIMSDTSLVPSQTLSIYSAHFSTGTKDSPSKFLEWEEYLCRTNKNCNNVVLSDKVHKAFFGGIQTFLDSEEVYKARGIPYKCNIVLSGPPGTGKSSMLKAAAATHKMPLFPMNLESIADDEELNTMQLKIMYHARNKPHMIVLDDVDRLCFFYRGWEREERQRQSASKITESGLLSLLDGVTENYGCIIVMCVNDRQRLNNVHALTRPGRVDHDVVVDYTRKEDVHRFLRVYFGRECDELPEGWESHDFQVGDDCTGAQIMGIMSEAGTAAAALDLLCDRAKMKEHHEAMASSGLRGNIPVALKRKIRRIRKRKPSEMVRNKLKDKERKLEWYVKMAKEHELKKAAWPVEKKQLEEKLEAALAKEREQERKEKEKKKKQEERRKKALAKEKEKEKKGKERGKRRRSTDDAPAAKRSRR